MNKNFSIAGFKPSSVETFEGVSRKYTDLLEGLNVSTSKVASVLEGKSKNKILDACIAVTTVTGELIKNYNSGVAEIVQSQIVARELPRLEELEDQSGIEALNKIVKAFSVELASIVVPEPSATGDALTVGDLEDFRQSITKLSKEFKEADIVTTKMVTEVQETYEMTSEPVASCLDSLYKTLNEAVRLFKQYTKVMEGNLDDAESLVRGLTAISQDSANQVSASNARTSEQWSADTAKARVKL
jgi:hypothetical protein